MEILVLLKQIPDESVWDDYQDVDSLNDSDKNILKEALNFRDKVGGSVTVMGIGPKAGEKVLKEALTFGVEKAILICDEAFSDLDIRGAGEVVAATVKETGPYDLILCGRQAIDGDSSHMAAMTSGALEIPLLAYSKEISLKDSRMQAVCAGDQEDYIVSSPFPVMILSVREQNQNRYPAVPDIMKTYHGEYKVEIIGNDRLGCIVPEKKVVQIRKYMPQNSKDRTLKMLGGKDYEECGRKVLEALKNLNFL